MLIYSDSKAANRLLVQIGGSTSGGSARVNAAMRTLGLTNTDMYGGYIVETEQAEPSFIGKRTTAWDLARLDRQLHLAAIAKGLLIARFAGVHADGSLSPVRPGPRARAGRLTRFLSGASVLHKAGWIGVARHDSGLVYWSGGCSSPRS